MIENMENFAAGILFGLALGWILGYWMGFFGKSSKRRENIESSEC